MPFDAAAFRVAFPAFASVAIYPDVTILTQADAAACFLAAQSCGCDTYSLQLMVAHLLTLATQIAAGTGGGGQVTSASIDKVSVGITAPPTRDGFSYWLGSSPYGLQLLALLAHCGIGGTYVGGRAERAAFRSVGGVFPRCGRF